jgi:hypothetical protein
MNIEFLQFPDIEVLFMLKIYVGSEVLNKVAENWYVVDLVIVIKIS